MFTFSRSCRALLLALFAMIATTNLHAEENLRDHVDALVQPYLDSKTVQCMTIGIIQNGETTVLGYGQLSAQDKSKPDGDTVYEIGSISKVFTGILLADAVTQGHVQLDQPASDLLPEGVKMPRRGKRPITLQDLATHVSGLPRLPDPFKPADWTNPYADFSDENLHEFLNRHQLTRPPGKKSEYSNLGMGLLGHLLSLQNKSSYEQLMIDRLVKPLQMANTTITFTKQQQSRLAPPHDGEGNPTTNWDIPTLAGAGGIRSTVNDMLLLAKANLNPPKNELGKALELAWKVHQKPLAKGNSPMGLAWHVAHDGHTRWHNGQTGGYHSMLLVNRKQNTAVILLTNTGTGKVDRLAQDILRMLAGEKVTPRTFKKFIQVKNFIQVPTKVMQRYVGKYELGPNFIFTVNVKKDKLMVGLTGQPTHEVYAASETEWSYKVVPATLTFAINKKGKCVSLELFQNGVRQTAKRIE